MEKEIQKLSKEEYHILSYCEERVGLGSFIRDALKIPNNNFLRLVIGLQKKGLITKGDYPVGGFEDYNYYITKKGTTLYAKYFKKNIYSPIDF